MSFLLIDYARILYGQITLYFRSLKEKKGEGRVKKGYMSTLFDGKAKLVQSTVGNCQPPLMIKPATVTCCVKKCNSNKKWSKCLFMSN